ncbi:MAG: hypothetical protein EOO99_00670 [Pedobacter sp.]|nr:MAG: hypothetical protein EOO99_00670 [Pedobacter sp.]
MKAIFYRVFILLSLFGLGSLNLYAQTFKLNGVVFDKETRLRVALAEIQNVRTGDRAGSNDMGMFSIQAQVGDSLVIFKRNYLPKGMIISSSKDVLVYLDKGVYLREVEIRGQQKSAVLKEMQQEFKNKGSYYMGKPPLLSFFFKPLTAIYELVGKTPRDARRFNNMYLTEVQLSEVDKLYNKSIIQKETGLSGKELEDFMVQYRPEYEKVKNWNTYDALKYIRDCYKQYRAPEPKK